ncbi:MAG: hypothetical protein GVY25_16730 [Bacteroidetes bacterium]|jgi:DNA repair exonuclease SbcCD ATPase subunit|nr:hypothetical protein [Bacteroidota bacterium]
MTIRSRLFALLLACTLVLAGCGDEETDDGSSSTPDTRTEILQQSQSLEGEIRAMLTTADTRITEVRQTLRAREGEIDPDLETTLGELETLRDSLQNDLKKLEAKDETVRTDRRTEVHERLDAFQHRLREVQLRAINSRSDFQSAISDRLIALSSRIERMALELDEAGEAAPPTHWHTIQRLRDKHKRLDAEIVRLPAGENAAFHESKSNIAGQIAAFGVEVERATDSLQSALAARDTLTERPAE